MYFVRFVASVFILFIFPCIICRLVDHKLNCTLNLHQNCVNNISKGDLILFPLCASTHRYFYINHLHWCTHEKGRILINMGYATNLKYKVNSVQGCRLLHCSLHCWFVSLDVSNPCLLIEHAFIWIIRYWLHFLQLACHLNSCDEFSANFKEKIFD